MNLSAFAAFVAAMGAADKRECANLGADAAECVEREGTGGFQGCMRCVLKVDIDARGSSCEELAAGSFCDDMSHCLMEADHCAYGECKESLDAFFDCAGNEEEKRCPGLCGSYPDPTATYAIA